MTKKHPHKKRSLDIRPAGKAHPHEHKPVEEKISSSSVVHLEESYFALPSEEVDPSVSQQMQEDGHFVKNSISVIKKGSKIGAEFNSSKVNQEEFNNREKTYLGRKGNASWNQNIQSLRKQFGFSWQRFGRRFAIFALIFSIFLVISTTAVSALAINLWNETRSIEDLEIDPDQSSVVFARDGVTKIFEFYKEEKREVASLCIAGKPLNEQSNCINKEMQSAVIALEDESFYQNDNGIPLRNILGASLKCLTSVGDECRGASGISQQLIKNITDDDDRSVDRKVRELFTAVKLNQNSSKLDILEKYLNLVPFGRNAYGVQQAAKSYFNKDAKDVNLVEACYLAAMIQLPSYYESGVKQIPLANSEAVTGTLPEGILDNPDVLDSSALTAARDLEFRKNACLNKLAEIEMPLQNGQFGKYIQTPQELENLKTKSTVSLTSTEGLEEAKKTEKTAFVTLPVDDPYPHFREYLTKEITKFISEKELYEAGYEIVTTLDPAVQAEAERIIKESESDIKVVGANNASGIILDGPTGQIVAMVGSLGYNREDIDGKVNIATSAQQPGSSIKPYIYAAAFQNGFNPGTLVTDVQTAWGGYTPKNFDGRFRGAVSLRRALQGSLNIPAVKSLFLVNDRPASDEKSKLDTFFGYAENVGVRFPCVEGAANSGFTTQNNGLETCSANATKGVTQEMVDKAYRNRCFIASALGGCELTMVSHATGMNTFFQDGNLRTSTPFISIKKKSTGEDIYAKKQASENPPYPQREADEDLRLISRQVTEVMSDYNARTAEFGSSRRFLELNDKRWKVAAKTGTSNGPRDFWTVGGSPYYTIAVWVGKTDNSAMDSRSSSSIIAAPIWKDMMEFMHRGKEVKNFSTEGLRRAFVSAGNLPENPDPANPNPQPKPIGSSELLTPKQIQQLGRKSGNVAVATPADIDKIRQDGIFVNRSAIVPVTYAINSVDGKLFNPGVNLETNRKEVTCFFLAGEFGLTNWQAPVQQLAQRDASYCQIPPISDQNQVNGQNQPPALNTNLIANQDFTESNILIGATFPETSGKSVAKISLFRGTGGSILVKEQPGNTLDVGVAEFVTTSGQTFNLVVRVTDNLGNNYDTAYNSVEFTL